MDRGALNMLNHRRGGETTLMIQILVTFDALLHRVPTSLEDMRAPEVPGWVRECLPINLSVMSDFHCIHPKDAISNSMKNKSEFLNLCTRT